MTQPTKQSLEELYIGRGLSVRDCDKELNLTQGSVLRLMKKYGIPRRQTPVGSKGIVQPSGELSNGWKGGKVDVACNSCGKIISRFPSLVRSEVFCSMECKKSLTARNYIGQKFGMLSVLEVEGKDKYYRQLFKCSCDCGGEKVVSSNTLSSGRAISCGCQKHLLGESNRGYKRVEISCCFCGKLFKVHPSRSANYANLACSKKCRSKWQSEASRGENNSRWIGGKDAVSYDAYASRLGYAEDIKRDDENEKILNVKCIYCNKWFRPTRAAAHSRADCLNGRIGGESRFYCSDGCKDSCPTYRKITWPAGFKKSSSREVVPELRKIVFERDGWECQMCGDTSFLHCHHVLSYKQNIILANDPDNCITLCKKCHKAVHEKEDCRYSDLQCKDEPIAVNQ